MAYIAPAAVLVEKMATSRPGLTNVLFMRETVPQELFEHFQHLKSTGVNYISIPNDFEKV